MMQGSRTPVVRNRLAWGLARARGLYLALLGGVLGVALVLSLTDELGRRVCGGAADISGAAILFGCSR